VSLEVLLAIATELALCSPPRQARCPRGYWLDGVRANGMYDCLRVPIGDDARLPNGHVVDRSVQPDGVINGWIFCSSGRPVVIDERTAGCG
jgi:hypothetical protein